jgi:hypothetical protein
MRFRRSAVLRLARGVSAAMGVSRAWVVVSASASVGGVFF